MTVTMNEDVGATFQKGLSEWWSEETEYVFQRIERWAAFARGYNRLRSQRLSRGRLTMQEEQEPRWSISSNKLIIDNTSWSPRFHTLKRCRRKSRPEETKINCCGTLNYQSNSSLDSTCLETYRYDHSIYFKTIGDIRNSKKQEAEKRSDTGEEQRKDSSGGEERFEFDAGSISEFLSNLDQDESNKNSPDTFSLNNAEGVNPIAWPIVDLSQLDLNADWVDSKEPKQLEERDEQNNITIRLEEDANENHVERTGSTRGPSSEGETLPNSEDGSESRDVAKGQDGIKRLLSFRKTRRLSRPVKQPPVVGDNNVVWPGVLLNYTKNIDPVSSPHRHYHNHHHYHHQRPIAQK